MKAAIVSFPVIKEGEWTKGRGGRKKNENGKVGQLFRAASSSPPSFSRSSIKHLPWGRGEESPIHCSYSQLINFVSDRFITRRTLLLREQSIFLSLSLPLQYLDTIWFDRPIDCYEIALVPVLWSCIGEFRSLIEEKFHFFLLFHSIFLKKKKKSKLKRKILSNFSFIYI